MLSFFDCYNAFNRLVIFNIANLFIMSQNATVLSYRFFNFHKKNQFLKITQQKWFEIISENQAILSAITKWWMSWWIWNSYSVDTKTENIVAYDLSIKKIIDEEDKKYIDLLAGYLNYSWEKHLGLIVWLIFGYIIGFLVMACLIWTIELLFWKEFTNNSKFIEAFFMYFFIATWPIFYIYFFFKDKKIEQEKQKTYQTKLQSYLQGITF